MRVGTGCSQEHASRVAIRGADLATASPYGLGLATTVALLTQPSTGLVFDRRLVIKVASPRQLVCDYSAPPHFPGPPLHVHPGFDETFAVLAGRLRVQVGEDVAELGPGAIAYVDGNLPHTFANPGSEPLRFLLVCSPGGFEDYFRAVAAGDEAAIAEVSQRFDYAPVG